MNLRRVSRILGHVLLVLAGAQLAPLPWCLGADGSQAIPGFLAGAATSAVLGLILRVLGSTEGEVYRREGVLIVVGAWVLASATGAVPYLATGAIASPVDALFESASGFTTTGASILTDIEALGRPLLLWRCFTQWLGGIGIVVLLVALLSELGPGARFLFKLEVPGPKAALLHARVRETAFALGRIYLVLSGLQVGAMLLTGVSLYDALTHTFSTVSTGGFSPYADSAAHFSTAVHLILIVFMAAAGLNFSLYYAAFTQRSLAPLRDVELFVYGALILLASGAIVFDLANHGVGTGFDGVVESVFQVVSIVTTTGFATADFAQWPDVARATLVALMFAGGCAGSTAGGVKIVRLAVAWRAAMREVRLTVNPNAVIAILVGRNVVPEESVRSVVSMLLLWVLAWGIGAILLSIGDVDLVTAATASIATLSNVGPGLAAVGPNESFAFFAPWQKLVMVGLMWLGRLEFFALLAVFQTSFWRR